MKKTVLRILLPALMGVYFSTATAQVKDDVLNWYNTKKTGMSTDKAYKKLKRIQPDTVIVAIIDSGIDIDHEDLQGKIWVNKGEVPGNGIDDDKNGYIDDVHGWNFLGNSDGELQDHARLNVTRIYAQLKPKYENVEAVDVESIEEYNLYLETKEKVEENREKYKSIIKQVKNFKENMLPNLPGMIANMMNQDTMTEENLNDWEPEGVREERMKQTGLQIVQGNLNEEALDEQIEQIQNMIDYHHNPDFNGRSVVGDDPYNMDDTAYGNNKVTGEHALHGTHVGGIVAALRGNDIGADGIAKNASLMVLRAVPDGDEFDKDVALAIRYAVDNGAKVINASFGKSYSSMPKAVYDAIIYAQEHDVLFVHAAGNSGEDLAESDNYPAVKYEFQNKSFTHLLTIGASTRNHDGSLAAPFSNYGKNQVDIFAPGAEIYNSVPDNKYRELQGTSMASPMVAGVAALIKGYFPTLSMEEVREVILESGDDFSETSQTLPGADYPTLFGTLSVTGKVVNVKSAVKLAKEKVEEKEESK